MASEANINQEMLALLADVRGYIEYWQELGVERMDAPTFLATALPPRVAPAVMPVSHTVLERHAQAPPPKLPPPRPTPSSVADKPKHIILPPPPPPSVRGKSSIANKMQETLFGEIAPDTSLPASAETLDDIRRDIGSACTRCPLGLQGRHCVVNSEGHPQARLMFIGEAPGADEDAQGRPFVGRAGQLLDKIIAAIGLRREEVFIGNINRCRPPQNRTPTTDEAAVCRPFLKREIAVVRPELIVVMGNTAMKNLLNTKEGITRLRGTFQEYHGVKVMPTFHPAYLLRDPSKKRETWEDMKKVRDYLARPAQN